jgi:aspartate/tyrosine/aromatic aminotransferase
MPEEGTMSRGFAPLVPPRADGPMAALEMQQRAVDMVLAANRLAVSWLQQASQHHAEVTRRMLDEMTETTRRMASLEPPPEKAMAAIEAVDRARALGVQTAQEISALMQRMQGDTAELLDTLLKKKEG